MTVSMVLLNQLEDLIMKKELLKGLTEEQVAKIMACNTTEEVLTVAREEGIELTDEQLEAVNGGGCFGSSDDKKDKEPGHRKIDN